MSVTTANQPFHLANVAATAELGRVLSHRLLKRRKQRLTASEKTGDPGLVTPDLILLKGELGAGKTSLIQGLAAGLGIEEPITSPSFALAQHYNGIIQLAHQQASESTALVHLDLYRLEEPASADELFLQEEEEAKALQAVMAVEWPERLSFTPAGACLVELGFKSNGRWVRICQG